MTDPGESSHVLLKSLAAGALVLLNCFFVAAEFALVRVRETQLDSLIARGNRRARTARHIVSHLETYIGVCQLGITLVGLASGALMEPLFGDLLEPLFNWLRVESERVRTLVAFACGFLANSYVLIVIGELAPKAVAIRRTLPTALWVSRPIMWFYYTAFPFIWLLNHSAQWLLARLGIEAVGESESAHSEEELRLVLGASQRRAGATQLGRDIVLNALDLRRRTAREVMRPRKEIVALDTTASIAECIEIAESTRYSRFPLCERGQLDATLGAVHIKDLYALRSQARTGADLVPSCHPLIYVPETARLEKLLQLFLERKTHQAIVVDEYGSTVGLVTLENILEEVVGQIQDEFDQEKPLVAQLDERTWEIDGVLPLHELSELVREPVSGDGVTTASGWVTQRVGGFPKVGDVVPVGRFELRVEEMEGIRVGRLRLVQRPEPPPSGP